MFKQDKLNLVNELKKELQERDVVLVLEHEKLTFASIDAARRNAAENTKIRKVKNRLAKIAFKDSNHSHLNTSLNQERILIMSDDLFKACKSAKFLAQNNKDTIKILQGASAKEHFDSNTINHLAQFDSHKELQSQLLRVIKVVGEKVLRVINAKFDNEK